jgi:hypothetical protein
MRIEYHPSVLCREHQVVHQHLDVATFVKIAAQPTSLRRERRKQRGIHQTGHNNSTVFSQPSFSTAHWVTIGNNNAINATQALSSTTRIRLEGNHQTATVRQN